MRNLAFVIGVAWIFIAGAILTLAFSLGDSRFGRGKVEVKAPIPGQKGEKHMGSMIEDVTAKFAEQDRRLDALEKEVGIRRPPPPLVTGHEDTEKAVKDALTEKGKVAPLGSKPPPKK